MGLSDRRLTGRDVLAKTFHAKTKRGYDPVEVDAYLELVAAQIDVLHGDIGRAAQEAAVAVPAPVPASLAPEQQAELEQLRLQNAELTSELTQERSVSEALRAENEQLRVQFTAVAPPPPAAEAPVEEVTETVASSAASEESYELVLRMAHRTAEDTIAQAHARADEIVAEAEFTAAQISKESDRKAFEAANRVQAEIASLNSEIETQRGELSALHGQSVAKRDELRGLANAIIQIADGHRAYEGAEVVDLRQQGDVNSEVTS